MSIPDFQSLMLPLLQHVSDDNVHEMGEVTRAIGISLKLSEDDLKQMLPSGRAPLFYNRLAWAKTYLKRAKLLEQPRRGAVQIAPRGRDVLSKNPLRIDLKLLRTFEDFTDDVDGEATPLSARQSSTTQVAEALSYEELLEQSHAKLRQELALELISTIKSCSASFFEHLVVQLMLAMGYGGSRQEAGRAVGRSGDGGIDGIISEDRLGLDAIYLQAKRWEGTVGRPEIMKFVGALAGQRANKGVFITTSVYSQEAKDYAASSQYKVVLIDGARLADLMIEHNLGVSVQASYELKRIDTDFFTEE